MPKKIIFNNKQNIGAADAESDTIFLPNCFVDTGDFEILSNCSDNRMILLGRTGSGKSALIKYLKDNNEHVIPIKLESLALTYITNSNIIQFFSEIGIKMDIFYRLLWKHIIVIEVLKERFHIDNHQQTSSILTWIGQQIPQKRAHQVGRDYFLEHAQNFWKTTDEQVKERTTTIENDLQGSVKGKIATIGELTAGAAKKLTQEEKTEIQHRAQEVVNKAQIKRLDDVISYLDEIILSDRKKKYFVTFDQLDEDWAEDNIRYQLIRALIEVSKKLTQDVPNLKVILAIRTDLLDRVTRFTRDTGFQEEKYRSCCLELSWNKDYLTQVLDNRIRYLFKDQYTNNPITHKDVLPEKIGKQQTLNFMLERTLMRPRDIIQFFNFYIKLSSENNKLSVDVLREAEGLYSRDRIRAIFYEWKGLYPNLEKYFGLLKRKTPSFSLVEITEDELLEICVNIYRSGDGEAGIDLDLIADVCEDRLSLSNFRKEIVLIFYKVGFVGIKQDGTSPVSWSHLGGVSISQAEIEDNTKISIQRSFWRVLGIYDRENKED